MQARMFTKWTKCLGKRDDETRAHGPRRCIADSQGRAGKRSGRDLEGMILFGVTECQNRCGIGMRIRLSFTNFPANNCLGL